MQLENRVAAVSGGTAGIGRAIAEAFLKEGARVAIMARNAEKGAKVIEEIGAGDKLIFVQGDATNQADVEGFIDQTVSTFGGIDILVNNAGGAGGDLQPAVLLTDDEFDFCMKVNVYSTFWATRRALKTMLENKWGRIINISSIEGKHGKAVFTAYTAAKHAINGITKSVAREVGTEGITVNSICPGIIITDVVKDNGPATAEAMGLTFDEMIDSFCADSAIKRPNTVEEVAAVTLLLTSDAGAGITGQQISVDGGTAQY
ncbi:MAG: SDR family oxidoreductase [Gammaproteobacteria bacterium]|jgi:3-hydroxybutyrate dehydrogenase|nr:SDR family oxidoreductase [Gammaproteobacteria bacterium]MBT4492695.1 SDR family oxidoreductase [Gammaproteobacteria bacterium]